MSLHYLELPKAPRWISTDAGQWAWHELDAWRGNALEALSVQHRSDLLREAEQLHQGREVVQHSEHELQ